MSRPGRERRIREVHLAKQINRAVLAAAAFDLWVLTWRLSRAFQRAAERLARLQLEITESWPKPQRPTHRRVRCQRGRG